MRTAVPEKLDDLYFFRGTGRLRGRNEFVMLARGKYGARGGSDAESDQQSGKEGLRHDEFKPIALVF